MHTSTNVIDIALLETHRILLHNPKVSTSIVNCKPKHVYRLTQSTPVE